MDERLAGAFLAGRGAVRVVLGVPLREPFALGHAFALGAVGSPLLGAGGYTLADLAVAVGICAARPAVGGVEASGWQPGLLVRWRMARAVRRIRALGTDGARMEALGREGAVLEGHLAEWGHGCVPEVWQSEERGARPVRSEPSLFRVAQLVRYAGLPLAAAWAMPYAQAAWYGAALAEANGADPQLMTDEQRRIIREAGYRL